jgi:hypothetical protein
MIMHQTFKKKLTLPPIKHVQFNEKTGHTAIVWDDGSEATVVRCGADEKFEPYAGFCAAIAKKLFGSTTAAKRTMNDLDVKKVAERKLADEKAEAAKRREQEAHNHERKVRSMAKRLGLVSEACELMMKKNGLDQALNNALSEMLNTGDKGGDDLLE